MRLSANRLVGSSMPRVEDAALLTGAARFIDDLAPVAGMRHAAILRSIHAHANIASIDVANASALPGVRVVLTGRQIAKTIKPIASVVRSPIRYLPCAVGKVRFVGEPVAVVVADDRYIAEDALDLIDVVYEPLPAAVSLQQALADDAPVLHGELDGNLVSTRTFRYGNPELAFEEADCVVEFEYSFPRYSSVPMETFGVIADFQTRPDRFSVWSNFQGPFILQPLMAAALGVPGGRLRLVTPPASGGSFGIKQAVFSYIVLLAAVSRLAGCPVKWIEDRAEHLTAASASSDRCGRVFGAFKADGTLNGLRYENTANMGAYLRPPEPASLYRMHAASGGCYGVENISVTNEIVVTNTAPVGLNRGYGGPQFYFALERLIEIAAKKLKLDIADIRRRNFIGKHQFPFKAPAGAIYDAGDYARSLDRLLDLAAYEDLKQRRQQAKSSGRLFGIGMGAGVEPSGSNMAYVTLAQSAQDRSAGSPKSGGTATASIAMDPTGSVLVRLSSTPSGQGHATITAQIVADRLGLELADIDVTTAIDTHSSPWSVASGNYSNRFSSVVVGAIDACAEKVARKLRQVAAHHLQAGIDDIELAEGRARLTGDPDRGMPLAKVAAAAHWDPNGLPQGISAGINETVFVSPETLRAPTEQDEVASAVTFGMVVDLAAVEIDRKTGRLDIIQYASVHDVGNQINPLVVEGQVFGGFVHGLGAAIFEELVYDDDGQFRSATFADYLCPTASEVPKLLTAHADTPSPTNPLGSKGMGDGSSMITPVVIANAAADALARDDIKLPLSMRRLWELANPELADDKNAAQAENNGANRSKDELGGEGMVSLKLPPQEVWRRLTDPDWLARIVPGCRDLKMVGTDRYEADVEIGVAAMRGLYRAVIEMREKDPPNSMTLTGWSSGDLGFGRGRGQVHLTAKDAGGTQLNYQWRGRVGGKVAAIGQRMLDAVTRALIKQFFQALDSPIPKPSSPGTWKRIRTWFFRQTTGARQVKPALFDYCRPRHQDEALDLLAQHGSDAVILAGGMSLGPMLNLRLSRPALVIDIGNITDLPGMSSDAGIVVTGAGMRQATALRSDVIAGQIPLLRQALPFVGHYQTRSRGTLCGSVAHADPSAEIPLCLTALAGKVVLRSAKRDRKIAAADFFLGAMTTTRRPDEMIVALEWPNSDNGDGFAFEEISERHGDFAIAAAACLVRRKEDKFDACRLALGGIEDVPRLIDLAPYQGEAISKNTIASIADFASRNVEPMTDRAASARQRRDYARTLAAGTIYRALQNQPGALP